VFLPPPARVYVIDARHFGATAFGSPKTGPHRAAFLVESVKALRDALRSQGSASAAASACLPPLSLEVALRFFAPFEVAATDEAQRDAGGGIPP